MKKYGIIVILSVLWLTPKFTYAQLSLNTVRTLSISTKDSVITCKLLTCSDGVKIKDSLWYYWEQQERIFRNQGGYKGNLLHGAYSVQNSKGNLMKQGSFYKGIFHGEWKTWDENGKLIHTALWEKGIIISENKNLPDSAIETIEYKGGIPYRKTLVKFPGNKKQVYRYKHDGWHAKRGLFQKRH